MKKPAEWRALISLPIESVTSAARVLPRPEQLIAPKFYPRAATEAKNI